MKQTKTNRRNVTIRCSQLIKERPLNLLTAMGVFFFSSLICKEEVRSMLTVYLNGPRGGAHAAAQLKDGGGLQEAMLDFQGDVVHAAWEHPGHWCDDIIYKWPRRAQEHHHNRLALKPDKSKRPMWSRLGKEALQVLTYNHICHLLRIVCDKSDLSTTTCHCKEKWNKFSERPWITSSKLQTRKRRSSLKKKKKRTINWNVPVKHEDLRRCIRTACVHEH